MSQISIADTGTYYKHEDLVNTLNLDLSYNFTNNTKDIFPINELYQDKLTAPYGHGTHVAGIICSEINNFKGIAGIVPSANLISLKALDRKLKGASTYNKSIAAFVEAVAYAKENNIKVINCSFGGVAPSKAEKDAMLNASNILFVIAAGNSGTDLSETPEYPACYYNDNSIVVANIDKNGYLAPDSNYGGPTDLAAPGTAIISTMPYNLYEPKSGTSAAAPFVTGICGVIWNQNETLTPEQVKAYVTNSSNVTLLDTLKDKTISGGVLNAYKSIVCPSLSDESIETQVLRNPSLDNIKLSISYYKNIAPTSSKTGEIIVKFKDYTEINEWIKKLNDTYAFKELTVTTYLDSVDAYVLRFSSINGADTAIDILNALNEVLYAEPNYLRE